MPLNTLGPLAAFGVGEKIGEANSPVTGIGLAIQNVVDDARKKGLLEAQSQFQTAGANQNAIAKEGRAEAALGLPKTTTFIGATPGEDRTHIGTRGEDVKSLPNEPFNILKLIEGLKGLGDETPGNQDIVGDETAAVEFLKANGLPDTPGNRAVALEQLQKQGQ